MKQLWLKYAAKIDALAQRERLIVFAALVVVVVYGMFALSVDLPQRQNLRAQLAKQRAEIAELQSKTEALQRNRVDPDAANRARVDDLARQINGIENTLQDLQKNLVPAQRVNALLQEMLTADARLQLVSLRSLPVALLLLERPGSPAAAGATAPGLAPKPDTGVANVYKHGVEMTLQGSYADLHDYLARLERSPWRMFWWRARLAAEAHPRLTLTVTIYTLSLDKGWLEV